MWQFKNSNSYIMQVEPFLFAIPLVAKEVARDWQRVCSLLQCTLNSILAQTDKNFSVVLVCHDVPDIPQLSDPRVIILHAASPLPRNPSEQMYDKGFKKRLAFSYLNKMGGGWVMLVDADDLVSKHLVSYVRKINPKYGLLIDRGLEFDCVSKKISKAFKFNRLCGSSAIFRFSISELPSEVDQQEMTLSDHFESHRLWREKSIELNRPFDFVNFFAAIYTINNLQNHSAFSGPAGWKRRAIRLLSLARQPTSSQIDEFSLDALLKIC